MSCKVAQVRSSMAFPLLHFSSSQEDGQTNLFPLKALRLKLVWFYLWFQKDKLYVESSSLRWWVVGSSNKKIY